MKEWEQNVYCNRPWQQDVPWYEHGVVKLEMHVWWTATGLGCAWDVCNMDRSAAQADRALVCGIILQVDDESRFRWMRDPLRHSSAHLAQCSTHGTLLAAVEGQSW